MAYLAGMVFGSTRGRLVLLGGLGAATAKLLLDKVPFLSARTGVTLGGNSELDRLIEQEIAAEMGMGDYVGPQAALTAPALGDYVGPTQVAQAPSLGAYDYPEFGEYYSGVEFPT